MWFIHYHEEKKYKIIDWQLVAKLVAAAKPTSEVLVGIEEDWSSTATAIFDNGTLIISDSVQQWSSWGTPVIRINGVQIKCYKMVTESYIYNRKHVTWPYNLTWPLYSMFNVRTEEEYYK